MMYSYNKDKKIAQRGLIKMTAKQRILSIRLAEKLKSNPKYVEKIGIKVTIVKNK